MYDGVPLPEGSGTTSLPMMIVQLMLLDGGAALAVAADDVSPINAARRRGGSRALIHEPLLVAQIAGACLTQGAVPQQA